MRLLVFLLVLTATLFGAKSAVFLDAALPLGFEAMGTNRYAARAAGVGISVDSEGADLQFAQDHIHLTFDGASPQSVPEPQDPLRARVNYFVGRSATDWRTNVELFGKIKIRGIYPGIDAVFYGNGKQFEYDWIVAPGADARRIRMTISGATELHIDRDGSLLIRGGSHELKQARPRVFQDGREMQGRFALHGTTASFEISHYNPAKPLTIDPIISYSTYLGGNDGDAIYATTVDNQGNLLIAGTTLSTNFPTRNSVIGPATGQAQAFVAKLSPASTDSMKTAGGGGSLLWSTYLGGADNFSYAMGISTDAQGNVLVTGTTAANNFPQVNGAQKVVNQVGSGGPCPASFFTTLTNTSCADAFVTKLTSSGDKIVFSTYLGGSGNDAGYGIASDTAGNVYVVGQTASSDFPAPGSAFQTSLHGLTDAFLARYAPDGTLAYSTYAGGEQDEIATNVAVTPAGSVYFAGATSSASLPVVSPYQTSRVGPVVGWVARFDQSPAGGITLGYSTYLGATRGATTITAMFLDSKGNLFLAGATSAADFPVTSNAVDPKYTLNPNSSTPAFLLPPYLLPTFQGLPVNGDAFVAELNPGGISTAQLVYSTFLGGSYNDVATGVTLDSSGHILVAGTTNSYDFPITGDAFITANGSSTVGGTMKAFLSVIDPTINGSAGLLFSSYFGGSANDLGIRVTSDGASAILVGQTRSKNLPVANPYQSAYGGDVTPSLIQGDAFVTRFDLTQNAPILAMAQNGASFQTGVGFAPGEIVTFKGSRLGPAQILLAQLDSTGKIATQLGACQLFIDGIAAPLVHSLDRQITAIVPYSLQTKSGQAVNAQAVCGSLKSNPLPMTIVDADPGVFSASIGTGPAVVVNQDRSINAITNPAQRGTIVTLFATGEGALNPPGVDGRIETGPLPGIPKPVLPAVVYFGGVASFDVPYIGVAPGVVDGLLQINARIPSDAPTGIIELLLQIGTRQSQKQLTITVR